MQVSEPTRFDAVYQKHLRALKLKGHAEKTIEAYARAVRRLAEYLGRCPERVSKDELDSYFAALLETHSWSTIKLDRNGLRFFFEEVLDTQLPWLDFAQAPKTQRLPDILTQVELAKIIGVTRRFDLRCFWFITYSLGLRLGEALNLEVGDIDAARARVHVRHGKGAKDRFVILPECTVTVLRKLWCSHRHPRLLFPGKRGPGQAFASNIMDRGTVQRGFKRAVAEAGLYKRLSIHSLRHSYATHMIEAGLSLRAVQAQLGHTCPKTTARYVHITEQSTTHAQALIDTLVRQLVMALRAEPMRELRT